MNDRDIIERRIRDPRQPPAVIAEIGVNHNGDLDLALQAIAAAAHCGADAVKFQTFHTEEFMADQELQYAYSSAGSVVRESMFDMFQRLELPDAWHGRLRDAAGDAGVVFLSSAADAQAVDLLLDLDVCAIKVASEDLINEPLLHHIAGRGPAVLLSTGMADALEIQRALDILATGSCEVTLLHCVSLYPTPLDQANLQRITALGRQFGCAVGYSDHTHGIAAARAATALGAVIIEKHFTIDRDMPGPDHSLSSDPAELCELVAATRETVQLLGSGALDPGTDEQAARRSFRRSIVAAIPIETGTRITRDMLALRRPAVGLPPCELQAVVGRLAARDFAVNDTVQWEGLT